MLSFIISLVVLVAGYFVYGRFVEKQFGIDESRTTPAIEFDDGVDFVPMPAWRIFMVQFLNIAGLGPIFGAIMGAMYGPAAFLWTVSCFSPLQLFFNLKALSLIVFICGRSLFAVIRTGSLNHRFREFIDRADSSLLIRHIIHDQRNNIRFGLSIERNAVFEWFKPGKLFQLLNDCR